MEAMIKLLREGARRPERGSAEAAGYDVFALLPEGQRVLEPNKFTKIPTGIAMAVPQGYCYMVCSRSGLAFKESVIIPHAPGIIDSDYRGEVMMLMANMSDEPFTIHNGDRIAQLVFIKHETPWIEIVEELPDSQRGVGGFGSTGTGVTLG